MSNENYVNHYVELLTSTMTDAVIRNISLQANAKISENVIIELQNKIEKLNSEVFKNEHTNEMEKNERVINLNSKIEEQKTYITNLETQLTELNNKKGEYENIKHQIGHIDTFKNELIKERDLHQQTKSDYELTIKELKERIDYLELVPAKRKKLDDAKILPVFEASEVNKINKESTKDGGSF